jgi:uncharacterized protein YjiS (DUF1127 family)
MGSIFLPRTAQPSLAVRLFDALGLWLERSRQRAALGRLDERMLADIGCDRASAEREAGKPFWRE